MIWETNSGIIAMVTKEVELGKIKCHKYWPDEKETLQCGTLEISWVSQSELSPDFSVRAFVVHHRRRNAFREVLQYFYHAWPDQGVPEKPLSVLQYLTAINKQRERNVLQNRSTGPVVVHCSAGIGRAGALIAIDISIQRLNDIGNIDVPQTVAQIRTQRPGAIQTSEQYEFIYEVLSIYQENKAALDKAQDTDLHEHILPSAGAIGLTDIEAKAIADLSGSGPVTEAEILGLSDVEQQILNELAGNGNGSRNTDADLRAAASDPLTGDEIVALREIAAGIFPTAK